MSASAGWQNWSSGCSPGGAATFTRGTGGGLPSSVSGTAAYLTGVPAERAGPLAEPAGWVESPAASAGWAGPAASDRWAGPAASAGWVGLLAASGGCAGPAVGPLAARPEFSKDTPALAVRTHKISAAMANAAPLAPPRLRLCTSTAAETMGPILLPRMTDGMFTFDRLRPGGRVRTGTPGGAAQWRLGRPTARPRTRPPRSGPGPAGRAGPPPRPHRLRLMPRRRWPE